jgi:peptidoglycan/LPS O-acetylase OafA/YrhL
VLRSITAVVAGYLLFGVSAAIFFPLTGRDPHDAAPPSFILWTTLYGIAVAMAGGYVASVIAPRRQRLHAAAVGLLIAIGATASLIAAPAGARWSQLTALCIMAPAAATAGMLRPERR